MRACFLIVTALACCAGCSNPPEPPTTPGLPANRETEPKSMPESNFPDASTGEAAGEWEEFFEDRFKRRELHFPEDSSEATNRSVWRYRSSDESDNLDSIRRGNAEGSALESSFNHSGGFSMSYDPELRRIGLKVGRDGNLHRVGPDARSASDPDEGPVLGWDELHRNQFGH